jgi:hypothetical protein
MIKRLEPIPDERRDLVIQLAVLHKDRAFIENRIDVLGKTPELTERSKRILREIRQIEARLRYIKARGGMKTRSEFAVRFKNVAREVLEPELYQRLIQETNASFREWAKGVLNECGNQGDCQG